MIGILGVLGLVGSFYLLATGNSWQGALCLGASLYCIAVWKDARA